VKRISGKRCDGILAVLVDWLKVDCVAFSRGDVSAQAGDAGKSVVLPAQRERGSVGKRMISFRRMCLRGRDVR